ncbi:MAG: hypothetical protein WDZ90_00295 [Candidatus Paceibacterota bacterium]
MTYHGALIAHHDHQDPGVPAGMGEQPEVTEVSEKQAFNRFSDNIDLWRTLAQTNGLKLPEEANSEDFRVWRNLCISAKVGGFRPLTESNGEVLPWPVAPFERKAKKKASGNEKPAKARKEPMPEERRKRALGTLEDERLLTDTSEKALKCRDAAFHALIDTATEESQLWDFIEIAGDAAARDDLRRGVVTHFEEFVDMLSRELREPLLEGVRARLGEQYDEIMNRRTGEMPSFITTPATSRKKPVDPNRRARQLHVSQAGPAKGPSAGNTDLRSNPEKAAKRKRREEQRKRK